jgi:putative membrane-bound dehydrogenase-like protein
MTFRLLTLASILLYGTIARGDEAPAIYDSEPPGTHPTTPDEALKSIKLPTGFQATLFAAEPEVRQPVAMAWDDRGRLWVAECYTYAEAAKNFDTELRDRLLIFEDTDGDGKHDRRTVFWDQGRKLSSIEIGFGGVWVLCAPQMLFIPDRDRNDVPDGPPEVVLDGWDEGPVRHNFVNGLRWGPDGWLYGRHGILATSLVGTPGAAASQRVPINCGIWRYHPTHKKFEIVCHGTTNPWGFDYDEHGEMFFITTVIGHLWHIVPGAYFERMFGTHFNPHVYQSIQQTADHVHWATGEKWQDAKKGVSSSTDAAGGGHAHSGLMIYQGDNWPAEYRGKLFTLNFHGRRINVEKLERQGASYVGHHQPDFCFWGDPWFRGIDLSYGPDGGVYVLDWSDTGECHEQEGIHRSSGRIYKITYGKPKPVEPFDLGKSNDADLVKLQLAPNAWWSRQARRILQERTTSVPAVSDVATIRPPLLEIFDRNSNLDFKLRALWTLYGCNAVDETWLARELFGNFEEYVRSAALRLLVDRAAVAGQDLPPTVQDVLERTSRSDASGLIALDLASAMPRFPIDARWPIADGLAIKRDFANDRVLPLLIWYGIEPAVTRNPEQAVKLAGRTKMPIVRRHIARRLTYEMDERPAPVEALIELAAASSDDAVRRDVLGGIAQALSGWVKVKAPANWEQAAAKLSASSDPETRKVTQELAVVFGDGRALDELVAIVKDTSRDTAMRRQSLRTLLASKPDNLLPLLVEILADRAVALEAVRGLALFDDEQTPQRLLAVLDRFGPEGRLEVINTLCARPPYAKALLQAMRDGRIKPSEISAFHARQIAALNDEPLTKQLIELWGDVRISSAEKRSLIDTWKSRLTGDGLANAQPSAGRALFQKTCANCHVLYGVGRKAGPDLTGSNRKNIDYLLENIIDPSASVGVDFRVLNVILDDGRVISGVVSEQNERVLTLQTERETITIDRKQIEESKPTTTSLMPDGLLQNLSPEQVRDLLAYLMTSEQVALPAE